MIAALVALAFALALGFPPGPAQAALSYADMPCHAEAAPGPISGEAPEAGSSCCLPLCWLAVRPVEGAVGERLRPIFVRIASISFASVLCRPRVPPPKRA
jgi:hypothetical protein